MVIESRATACKRGAASPLFLSGYGTSSDAYHLTAPSPDGVGLRAALHDALAEAGIAPREVGFVNAHGTGTHENDMVEGKVLADIFGPDLIMLSTKGYTGHTLGAAGGIEAVFTAAGLRSGWVPASAGFQNKDETIPIAPVRKKTLINRSFALSTSLAFGGTNAAIVIGRETGV
jgi:3-oxoacyl-(acyl-carrier-protein) synthase